MGQVECMPDAATHSPESRIRQPLINLMFQMCREAGLSDTYIAEHINERLTQDNLTILAFNTCNDCREILGLSKRSMFEEIDGESVAELCRRVVG